METFKLVLLEMGMCCIVFESVCNLLLGDGFEKIENIVFGTQNKLKTNVPGK